MALRRPRTSAWLATIACSAVAPLWLPPTWFPTTGGRASAAAAQDEPDDSSPVDLPLVRQAFEVLPQPLDISVVTDTLLPPGTDPADVDLLVTAHGVLDGPESFAEAQRGDIGRSFDSVRVELAATQQAVGGARVLSVPVETTTRTAAALRLRDAGLYPIVVELRVDGETVASVQTYVHRLPDPAVEQPDPADGAVPPMQVALVAAVGSAPAAVFDSAVVDPAAHESLRRLVDLLEATPAPLTASLPPELLEAMVTSDPRLVERLVRALQADDEILASPYVPFDPSSAATGRGAAVDGVETFTRLLRQGEEALGATVTAATSRNAWLAGSTPISEPALAMLRDLGVRTLVVSEASYARTDGNAEELTDVSLYARTRLPDGTTMPTAVVDGGFAVAEVRSRANLEQAAVAYVAELVARRSAPDTDDDERDAGSSQRRTTTIGLADLDVPDATFVARVMELVTASPVLEPVTMSTAAVSTDEMAFPDPVVLRLPPTAGPDVTGRLELVAQMIEQTDSTASMLDAGDPRPPRWSRVIDVLPSTALDDGAAQAAVEQLRGEMGEIRSIVRPPESFSFTLSGSRSSVPLRFENTGTEPVKIMLRLSSPKLRFLNNDQVVALTPGVHEVTVEVDALSNGRTPVALQVLTPAGGQLTDPIPLTARVNAFTGLAQVLTLVALGLLATWWLHHWRSVRRRRGTGGAQRRHPAAAPQPDATARVEEPSALPTSPAK